MLDRSIQHKPPTIILAMDDSFQGFGGPNLADFSVQSVVREAGGDDGGDADEQGREQGRVEKLALAQVASQRDGSVGDYPGDGARLGRQKAPVVRPPGKPRGHDPRQQRQVDTCIE